MTHSKDIAKQLNIKVQKVKSTIDLLDDGNTLAFIARYRKEATGELDEEQIRQIIDSLDILRKLDERKKTILSTIKKLGKLSPKLQKEIDSANTRTALEDLYLPFKPKRKTRANLAVEKGLEKLAKIILQQPPGNKPPSDFALPYIGGQVKNEAEAWEGARDILAEMINENPIIRKEIRENIQKWGLISTTKVKKAEDPRGTFESYYAFDHGINNIKPHQILAINRGERLKVLRVKMKNNERDWKNVICAHFKIDRRSPLSGQLEEAINDSAARLLLPSIKRDIRRELKEIAENHAINIFSSNLRALLSQPPLSGHTVLGLDPGYRTGCKLAVVNSSGKVLDTGTIYPHKPQSKIAESNNFLWGWIDKYNISLVAIGNGTASRESEELIAELINSKFNKLRYLVVNEAGASVYSASKLARAEFPNMDVSLRGAVSIARRVQDPLAELVKIDPKSIGVGLYQHDVDQKKLATSLKSVVESVVNLVGADLATASSALLSHISGISEKLATRIEKYRDEHGVFPDRESLKKVPGLGPKAYEQSAGFIRIHNGKNKLDASAIHPENYAAAQKILNKAGTTLDDPLDSRKLKINNLIKTFGKDTLALETSIGISTLEDILAQLIQPGRDPRKDLDRPLLKSDILKIEALKPGMILKGSVRNVIDFGAFIDIGVKQDGLLHISQIPKGLKLQVGTTVMVEIHKVEEERGRISLHWVSAGGS